jgi:hypothetical protein
MRASILLVLVLATACDKPSSSTSTASTSAASASPSASAATTASASASASASAVASAAAAPSNALTAERRAKIEAAIPEAKDFVDAKEIGHELGTATDFNKAFADAIAKKGAGKWILFRGTMNAIQKDSFAIAVTMLDVDPNSPFGAPKAVVFTAKEIKGYDAAKYKAGDDGAILAKLTPGKNEIKPGFDLVALGNW